MGRLTVRLIAGRNLLAADPNGKSDPYVIMKLRSGGPQVRSKTVPKTLNPVWSETFFFDVVSVDEILDVFVYDEDRLTKDDPLGRLSVSLRNVPRGVDANNDWWFKLEEVSTGEIELSLTIEDVATPNPYKIHYNTLAGGLTADTASGDALTEKFPTYEIGMFHVRTIFGSTTQPWNEKYDNAQKIFGTGPKAAIARGVIHMQHAELYRDGVLPGRTKTGTIETGDQFLALINNGYRNDIPRFFTYVLLDDKLHFSETGASFFKDFMSKHATHADCAREVRYAGEFHIQMSPKPRLVIDNNSGTYGPNPEILPKLVHVLKINFPGLEVEGLHFADPQLAAYKKQFDEEKATVVSRLKSSGGLLRNASAGV